MNRGAERRTALASTEASVVSPDWQGVADFGPDLESEVKGLDRASALAEE